MLFKKETVCFLCYFVCDMLLKIIFPVFYRDNMVSGRAFSDTLFNEKSSYLR